jgi:hypothetical protein
LFYDARPNWKKRPERESLTYLPRRNIGDTPPRSLATSPGIGSATISAGDHGCGGGEFCSGSLPFLVLRLLDFSELLAFFAHPSNLGRAPSMPNSIEDILVCIHDDPELDEHTKLGRMVREVSAHLVPFGHYRASADREGIQGQEPGDAA